MSERMIHCLNEGRRFPASEFLSINGKLVVPEVHNTEFPHYAGSGEPWEGDDPSRSLGLGEKRPRPEE